MGLSGRWRLVNSSPSSRLLCLSVSSTQCRCGWTSKLWEFRPMKKYFLASQAASREKTNNIWQGQWRMSFCEEEPAVGGLCPRCHNSCRRLPTPTPGSSMSRDPWLSGSGVRDCGRWYLHTGIYMFSVHGSEAKKRRLQNPNANASLSPRGRAQDG